MAAILLGPGAQKVERFHKINCSTSLCFLSSIFECKRTLKKCIIFRLHLPEGNHQAVNNICYPIYVSKQKDIYALKIVRQCLAFAMEYLGYYSSKVLKLVLVPCYSLSKQRFKTQFKNSTSV